MYKADSRAFTRWLKHVANRDTDGTVLMIQIENEIGMLESPRDYSPAAQTAYDKGVPTALIDHLKNTRHHFIRSWRRDGATTA